MNSTSWIQVSTSRIHDFSFMNSRFQLHEYTISISWSWNCEFMKLNSWSWNREFMKLKSWIHEVKIVNSLSWNCKFVKLKSGIHEDEIGNSWSWKNPISLGTVLTVLIKPFGAYFWYSQFYCLRKHVLLFIILRGIHIRVNITQS
jgi:hypothetical protein